MSDISMSEISMCVLWVLLGGGLLFVLGTPIFLLVFGP